MSGLEKNSIYYNGKRYRITDDDGNFRYTDYIDWIGFMNRRIIEFRFLYKARKWLRRKTWEKV